MVLIFEAHGDGRKENFRAFLSRVTLKAWAKLVGQFFGHLTSFR